VFRIAGRGGEVLTEARPRFEGGMAELMVQTGRLLARLDQPRSDTLA